MPELLLYKRRGKALWLLLGSATFVALGIWLLSLPDAPALVAWLCICFFGLGLPISIFQLADRRPQIILNEVGIFDRTIYPDFINWEVIQDAYLGEVQDQSFICLVVDEEFEPSRHRGAWRRSMAQLNKGLGFQELNVNTAWAQVDAARLTELILAMLAAEKPERTFLVEKAIANL